MIEDAVKATPQAEIFNEFMFEVLEYCEYPKSVDDIKDRYQKSKDYIRKEILPVLIKNGFLHYTIPKKPTSTKQKYILTDLGKELLRNL